MPGLSPTYYMIMNSYLIRSLFVLIAIAISASGGAAQKEVQTPGLAGNQSTTVAAEKPAPSSTLTPDVIYNILVGEIALQRRDLGMAYEHQLKGAEMARDAVAAERAARIAMHQKDQAKVTVMFVFFIPEIGKEFYSCSVNH